MESHSVTLCYGMKTSGAMTAALQILSTILTDYENQEILS